MVGPQFHHWLRWVAVVVLHETDTWKCKCYKLGLFISLFTVTFQCQQKRRECEDCGFMSFLVFPSVMRWLDENLPTRGKEGDTGSQGFHSPQEGVRGFCSETTHSRMVPRNCPTLGFLLQKEIHKDSTCNKSQWRETRRRRKRNLLKTASNFFFLVHVNFLNKRRFADDWFLQVFFCLRFGVIVKYPKMLSTV